MPVKALSKRSTVNRIKNRKKRTSNISSSQSSSKPKYHYGKKRKHR